MATTAEAADPPASATPRSAAVGSSGGAGRSIPFRPDIDGLRAVAILLVVGFHAAVPGFDAGFVGVDVFFVISGFLIMSQLEGELERTGTIRLATFWARRARRLIPAATLVLVAVAIITPLVTPVFQWRSVAGEVLAAAFYGANELFRAQATDYFAAQVATSPLLNMWSLAVEEQFYLFWPLVLFATSRLPSDPGDDGARARRSRRIAAISLIAALSFVVSLSLTRDGSQAAYFGAAARAWEFGVGALLAILAPRLTGWGAARTRVAGAVGVALLAVAVVVIDKTTPFPGVAALLPVCGTAGVLVAGVGTDRWPARTLGCRPLQAVGRLSYSWYLWHWPVLVLGLRWHPDNALWWHVALVALALVPAFAAHRFVETPIRNWTLLTTSNRRTLVAVLALLGISAASAGVLWLRAETTMRDPFIAKVESARLDLSPLPDECVTTDLAALEQHCVWGDPSAARTVLLLGDSHAGHWLPAIDLVGQHQHLRILASMQGNCPGTGYGWRGQLPTCTDRIAAIPDLLRALRPDLVVMSNSSGYLGGLTDADGQVVAADAQLDAWRAGVRDRATLLKELGVPLLVILDTPRYQVDPIECLMRERRAEPCAAPLAPILEVLEPVHQAERDGLADAGHGTSFDPVPVLCPEASCPAIADDIVVYGRFLHMTTVYARTLEAPVGAAMTAAMTGPP